MVALLIATHLENSRSHRYFWNTVYDEESWEKEKPGAFSALGLPENFESMLAILKSEFIPMANHILDCLT